MQHPYPDVLAFVFLGGDDLFFLFHIPIIDMFKFILPCFLQKQKKVVF